MADFKQCEFLLLRYMPDAVKEEFVNIGVVLLEDGGDFAGVRFTRDWRRVRCLDPAADVEMLEALESDLRRQLGRAAERETFLAKLQDSCSNVLQLTAPKACLAADPQQELEALARLYLERRRAGKREAAGRQVILGRMRDAFEQAGVWALMSHKIAAAQYTHKGDPLKVDCGYKPNGVIRLFHAVSLESDLDAAKVLAFSFPEVREGIARVEKAKAELTAVVEPDLERDDESIAFALAVMQRSQIAVATTADLPRLADVARQELHV
jgi:hypothetical protein